MFLPVGSSQLAYRVDGVPSPSLPFIESRLLLACAYARSIARHVFRVHESWYRVRNLPLPSSSDRLRGWASNSVDALHNTWKAMVRLVRSSLRFCLSYLFDFVFFFSLCFIIRLFFSLWSSDLEPWLLSLSSLRAGGRGVERTVGVRPGTVRYG